MRIATHAQLQITTRRLSVDVAEWPERAECRRDSCDQEQCAPRGLPCGKVRRTVGTGARLVSNAQGILMMTRDEHLEWAKQRAREYLDRNDWPQAWVSMVNDLNQHPV